MYADIAMGLVNLGTSAIGYQKNVQRRNNAESAYDNALNEYMNQDTSNLFQNLQNPYEDLTVNQQQAEFVRNSQNQALSNTLQANRQAAGSSGIAAMVQSLANVQSQNLQQASASIGQQEAGNTRLMAQGFASNQMAERQGAVAARDAQNQLLGTKVQLDAADYAAKTNLVQNQQMAMAQGAGQLMGGVGAAFGDYLLGYDGDNALLKNLATGQKNRYEYLNPSTT